MGTKRLFEKTGVHVLVDGQFGSTGKGALAAWLAYLACRRAEIDNSAEIDNFNGVIYSGGPNSGHTSYYGQEKIVLKQLPTFAIHAHMMGKTLPVYLSAGAVIDNDVLREEARRYPGIPIFVHPNAAVINPADIEDERGGSIAAVAGTRSGTGAALARKIYRDPSAIARNGLQAMPPNVTFLKHRIKPEIGAYFMEIAQGFSLGINSHFYPHVTSRECTVMQGIADARIPPRHVAKTYMCIRTYPIRVGNVDGFSSGDWYPDQQEVTWEQIGQTPELTTVTKRVRRVATFSEEQFFEALHANDPDWIAINFMNYLTRAEQLLLIENMITARELLSKPFGLIGGYGPNITNWGIL